MNKHPRVGRPPLLNDKQAARLKEKYATGKYTLAALAEEFGVGIATAHRYATA